MDINTFEIQIWRNWKNNKTGEIFSFSPAPYANENFKDFKLTHVKTPDNKITYPVGYRIYELNSKAILQIVDTIYELRRIDDRLKPATMILLDEFNNQITFTESI